MANEKYKVLKIISHGEWLRGCPLFVVRSQIIRNNENNRLFLVNEMANIGVRTIKSAIIRIDCLDADGNMISSVDNCAYQGLNVEKQAVFGGNKLFGIAEGTDSVSIIIKKLTYSDGTEWSNEYLLKGLKISNPVRIDPQDSVYDVVKARCNDNHIVPKFWPYEFTGGWRCTCAQLNDEDDMSCSLCGASKFWVLDNLNRDDIIEYKERVEREIRLRIEREAEERRLAAEREAEERRLAAEREAEERRLAEERAEEERRRAEEEARLAAEREAEEKRLAEERAIEEARRAEAEKKAAEERARLDLLMAKKEAVRQYNKQQTKKSFGKGIILVCVLAALVAIGFGAFELYQVIRINDRYESAKKYISNYNYEEAIKVYKSLGGYKDSQEKVLETKYDYAEYLTIINRYGDAVNIYTELGSYKNSTQHIPQVYLEWGNYARENKQYAEAFEYYEKAGNLVNQDVFSQTSFEYAVSLMESGSFQEALDIFGSIAEMTGVPTKVAECYYLWGKSYLNQSRFDEAIECFKHSFNVEDTNELNKKAYYLKGNKMAASNKIEEAYNCYLNAGDYEDAQEKKNALIYDMGVLRLEQGNYNAAVMLLANVSDTTEITDKYNEAKYKYAEFMLSQNVDERILNIYKELPKDYEDCEERIKLIEKFIGNVGKYVCSDEKAPVQEVVVIMTITDGEVWLRANGEVVDTSTLKSENCSIDKKGTLQFVNSDGVKYTYKK